MNFQEKYFSCYNLLTDQGSFIWLDLLREILGNMCTAIDWQPGCVVMDFKIKGGLSARMT